jgi:hypothetical protein
MSCNLEEPQQPPATTHEGKKIHINGSYLLQGAAAAAKHLHDTVAKIVQPQLFRSSAHKGQSKHYIILHIVVVHHSIVQKLTIKKVNSFLQTDALSYNILGNTCQDQ